MGLRKAASADRHPASPVTGPTTAATVADRVDPTALSAGPSEPVRPETSTPEPVEIGASASTDSSTEIADPPVVGNDTVSAETTAPERSNVVAIASRPASTATPAPQTTTRTPGSPEPVETTARVTRTKATSPRQRPGAPVTAAEGLAERPAAPAVKSAAPQPRVAPAPERTPEQAPEKGVDKAPEKAVDPSPTASATTFLGGELRTPDQPPANVARVRASKRGKRDVNYSWPKVDYALMQAAWEECKPVYSRHWRREDPGGSYRLGFSAFVAKAMLKAFEDVDAWLDTVRNDGRLEPVPGGRQQVGLVWPVEVENQVIDLWESLDRSRFPADFALTKQHLAAAAILHGLKSVSQWLLEADNDDRFSIPVEADGRLRANRPAETAAVS